MSEIDYGARACLDHVEAASGAVSGNLIAAIKEYRGITGAELADAKKAVEDIR